MFVITSNTIQVLVLTKSSARLTLHVIYIVIARVVIALEISVEVRASIHLQFDGGLRIVLEKSLWFDELASS